MNFNSFEDAVSFLKKKFSNEYRRNKLAIVFSAFFIFFSIILISNYYEISWTLIPSTLLFLGIFLLCAPWKSISEKEVINYIDTFLDTKERAQTFSELDKNDLRKEYIASQLLELSKNRINFLQYKKTNYIPLILSFIFLLLTYFYFQKEVKNPEVIQSINKVLEENEEKLSEEVKESLQDLKETVKLHDLSSDEVSTSIKNLESALSESKDSLTPTPTPTPTATPTNTPTPLQTPEQTKSQSEEKKENSSDSKEKKGGSGNQESKDKGEEDKNSKKDQKGKGGGEGEEKESSQEGKKQDGKEGKDSANDQVKKLTDSIKKKSQEEKGDKKEQKDSSGKKEEDGKDKEQQGKESKSDQEKKQGEDKEQKGKEGNEGKPDDKGEKDKDKAPDQSKDPKGKDSKEKGDEGKKENNEAKSTPKESESDKAEKSSGDQGERPEDKDGEGQEIKPPPKVKDVELPGTEEQINLDKLSEKEQKVKNNEEAQYKTKLSDIKKEKSDAVIEEDSQYIPPEYEEYF